MAGMDTLYVVAIIFWVNQTFSSSKRISIEVVELPLTETKVRYSAADERTIDADVVFLRATAECLNNSETSNKANYRAYTFSLPDAFDALIDTESGTTGGTGAPLTNRSGCVR